MKISTNTINVLKSFAKINPSILVNPGSTLKSISPTSTIMGIAKVDTSFDKKFAIYNLDRFLSTISLYNQPELNFKENWVEIVDGPKKTRYYYTPESTVKKAPDKEIPLPSVDVQFKLTADDLKSVEKAAGILGLPELVIRGNGSKIYLETKDTTIKTESSDGTGDSYSVEVGDTDKDFTAVFKFTNIRILEGDYNVSISAKGISKFEGINLPVEVTYFIAVEQHSEF